MKYLFIEMSEKMW